MKKPGFVLPLLIGVLGVLCASAASASSPMLHPNLQRGVDQVSKYQQESFPDLGMDVNLFNGNLGLTVNLGKSYPLDHDDDYRFDISYNSNIWDFDATGQARASKLWNAGLGFAFSFGRLVEPADATNETGRWLYVDPRGTWHVFNSNLHAGYPDVDDPDDEVLYTQDSTYYRLHLESASRVTLHSASGQSRTFRKSGGEWRLTRYTAQGGQAWVDVSYSADGLTWTFTDSHGRVHRAVFAVHAATGRTVLDRLEQAAFGGTTATWRFGYSTLTTHLPCGQGGTVTEPALTTITGPLGYVQELTYFTAANSGCSKSGRLRSIDLRSGGVLAWDYGDFDFPPASCGSFAGVPSVVPGVTSWRKELPSGAVIGEWSITPMALAPAYGGASQSAADSCDAVHRQVHVNTPRGDRHEYLFTVATKIMKAADGVTILGGPAEYGLPLARSWMVGAGAGRGQRALSERIFDCDANGQNCELVRRTWEVWEQDLLCSNLQFECFTEANRRLRGRKVTYDDETANLGYPTFKDELFQEFDGFGHYRVESLRSNTHGGAATVFSSTREFNAGQGVYEPAQGSYGGIPAGTSTFTMLPTASRWTLQDFTYELLWDEVTNGFQRRDFCFDDEGNLLRERRRRFHDRLAGADIVVERAYSGGSPIRRSHFGAYAGGMPTGSGWCSQALGTATFEEQQVYQYGALAESFHVTPTGARVYSESDVEETIDRNTGLVASERDSAGLETRFTHDALGRLIWIKPSANHGGAWINRSFRTPTGGSAWSHGIRISEYRYPNGGGTALPDRQHLWLDLFDNAPVGEQVLMPDGRWSRRRWIWGAAGDLTHESTTFDPVAGGLRWTFYMEHDPFGRPRRLRPPEGAAHDTVIRYYGERKVERVMQSGHNYAGSATVSGVCYEAPVTYTTELDFKGRVAREVEDRPQPSPGLVVETIHGYDVADHRTRTETKRTVAGVTARSIQTRSYDGRGLLTQENQTSDQNGTWSRTTHLNVDARGNPVRTRSEGTSYYYPLTVRNFYDRAGRLVLVRDELSAESPWKEFEYASSNAAGDHRRGKLVRAVRHNYWNWTDPAYPQTDSTIVEDTYEYKAVGGLRSAQVMYARGEVAQPSGFPRKYRTEIAYDAQENPTAVTYPWCLQCSSQEPPLVRRIDNEYSHGSFLVGLGGYEDGAPDGTWDESFAWTPRGRRVRRAVHGNGMVDEYVPGVDPERQYERVLVDSSGATCKSNCLSVDSGEIVYDGEGEVCGAGPNKLTGPPPAEPSLSVFDSGSCGARAFRDPFGQPNGNHWSDSSDPKNCGGTDRYYYDAFDRLVAHTDRSATEQVEIVGVGWTWMADRDRFHITWFLHGVTGELLREVDVGLQDGWWSTHDRIQGPMGLHGRERAVRFYGTQVRHVHPMTYSETMAPNAYETDPGSDEVGPLASAVVAQTRASLREVSGSSQENVCGGECEPLEEIRDRDRQDPKCADEGAREGMCRLEWMAGTFVPQLGWSCTGVGVWASIGDTLDNMSSNTRETCKATMWSLYRTLEKKIFTDELDAGICEEPTSSIECGSLFGIDFARISPLTLITFHLVPKRLNACNPDAPGFDAEDCCDKYKCVSCESPDHYPDVESCEDECFLPLMSCTPVEAGGESCYRCEDPCPGDDLLTPLECATACGEDEECARADKCFFCRKKPKPPEPKGPPATCSYLVVTSNWYQLIELHELHIQEFRIPCNE